MKINRDQLMQAIMSSRKKIIDPRPAIPVQKTDEEGGCGVVGFAASVPVSGRHIFEPSIQMHNRGNGKGGGIAAASFMPEQLGVDEAILRDDYILQIALLDPSAQEEVEKNSIEPYFNIDHQTRLEPVADYKDIGLEVQPPDIVRYFVRVKPEALEKFAVEHGFADNAERAVEDEFVYQSSIQINQRFYASLGEKRAFILSHGRNLMIFKIVGYAEQVVQYYGLEDVKANIWIAHQRYPTKGRVWHPAGAHPFIGLNDALVHNGDFANYYSVAEYLRQNNIVPQFLTDTEVSVLMFDLLSRTYGYPLEYVIEALAPTTELDFDSLPEEKRNLYRAIQSTHIQGSPDGPWFFIVARSEVDEDRYRLLGITDTAMLRPQVFAFQEGEVSIGLVASEKQAIDATLQSLAEDDNRFRRVADRYWNARGGSHTDGGAFIFTLQGSNGSRTLTCTDKFGREIENTPGEWALDLGSVKAPQGSESLADKISNGAGAEGAFERFKELLGVIASWRLEELAWLMDQIMAVADRDDDGFEFALALLTMLNDRKYDCGNMKASMVLEIVHGTIHKILDRLPAIGSGPAGRCKRIDWSSREQLVGPTTAETTLVIFARDFPPEGPDCDALLAVAAYKAGWRRFIVYGLKGQRFHGCGFGPKTDDVRLDLYDSSGDYISSGMDGMDIFIHGNAQDQLGQIMKRGRLVVYGDVGQTFLYGAKGGEVYIMGNAAGRPLINAVGRPRVVINGTCLDFLAESFMAGDPHQGGGFVVLNGIQFDDQGRIVSQPTPYPGSNLFSLASGGAIFVRDPERKLVPEQLNGGEFTELTNKDWRLILPYLEQNEELFGISIEDDLLTIDGELRSPLEVYRKVRAVSLGVLAKQAVPE